jgi:hypothetical protein
MIEHNYDLPADIVANILLEHSYFDAPKYIASNRPNYTQDEINDAYAVFNKIKEQMKTKVDITA